MLKAILYPNRYNIIIWLSAIYFVFFLSTGKIDALIVVFAYFFESILIGFFNALKMIWTLSFGKEERENKSIFKYGIVLFFIVHYGFFIAVQSIFGFAFFNLAGNSFIKEPFDILENYSSFLSLPEIKYALPAIVFLHITKFITGFIMPKKYDSYTAQELLFKPYVRIFIQQFTVLLSIFLVVLTKTGFVAALLLILIRLIIDLALEAIRKDSNFLNYLSNKLANKKAQPDEVKKQLLFFSE